MIGKVFQHDSSRAALDTASPGRDDRKDNVPDLETTLKGPKPKKRETQTHTHAHALAAGLTAQAADAQTLKTVKDRGMLSCGVSQGLPGFSSPDDKGNWTGLDVDVCRAIAGAIFNDPTKVKFVALTAKDRFTALQSGDVDVLIRNTTWSSSRDTQLGLNGTSSNYYDVQ